MVTDVVHAHAAVAALVRVGRVRAVLLGGHGHSQGEQSQSELHGEARGG